MYNFLNMQHATYEYTLLVLTWSFLNVRILYRIFSTISLVQVILISCLNICNYTLADLSAFYLYLRHLVYVKGRVILICLKHSSNFQFSCSMRHDALLANSLILSLPFHLSLLAYTLRGNYPSLGDSLT